MRLGFINVWGIGTTPVNEVNIIYNGNKESLKFTQEPDKEVSDTRKYFFNGAIQNIFIDIICFSALKKSSQVQTSLFIFIKLSYLFPCYHSW